MQYLKSLNKILKITGNRDENSFPINDLSYEQIKFEDFHQRYIYDIEISKKILSSQNHISLKFYEKILTDTRYGALKKVSNRLLLFQEDKHHDSLKRQLFQELKILEKHIKSNYDFKSSFDKALLNNPKSTFEFCEIYINQLFNKILNFYLQTKIDIKEISKIDFFNSFPKHSTLNNLNIYCEEILGILNSNNSLTGVKKQLILVLFLMGWDPLIASTIALINNLKKNLEETNFNYSLALERTQKINFSNILPVNFTMRKCISSEEIIDITFNKGDISYLFLGTSKCPFSKATSIPFGFGKHKCPGEKLSLSIFNLTMKSLQNLSNENISKISKLKVSNVKKKGVSAFLKYVK